MGETMKYYRQWEENVKRDIFDPVTWHRQERQLNHPDRKWLKENIKEPVLDVGCGGATDGNLYVDYVGIDITPSFIRSGKENGVCNLIIADARNLPLLTKSIKTSYCKDVLLHMTFDDVLIVLKELLRVGHETFVAWGIEYIGGERLGKTKNRTPVKKIYYTPFIPNKFPMKFVRKNRKRGMLNYKDGEIYHMPKRHAAYPWWKTVEGEEFKIKTRGSRKKGFWYNRFSREKLNQHCRIGSVIDGTSITEVKEK